MSLFFDRFDSMIENFMLLSDESKIFEYLISNDININN